MKNISLFISFIIFAGLVSCKEDPKTIIKPNVDETVAVTDVVLDSETLSLLPGERATLKALVTPDDATNPALVWESTHPQIAEVTQKGKVIAFTPGETEIAVTSLDGGIMAVCSVTVRSTVTVARIEFNKQTLSMVEDEDYTLIATVYPDTAADKGMVWASSDEDVATVDSAGKISAVAAGRTTIVAVTTDDTKIATCTVTVYKAEKWGRSNLVWIPDTRLASGGVLTFAVNPDDHAEGERSIMADDGTGTQVEVAVPAIPANTQGVCFKWGSLVAVSPAVGNPALFAPTGKITFDGYADIPSMSGEMTPPFNDATTGDTDDFATYNGGTGFDAATDRGDICRYISAQGWVTGRWRLPTVTEIEELSASQVVWSDSKWGVVALPDGEENAHGFYQPLSGYFFGESVIRDDDRANPANGVSMPASGYIRPNGLDGLGYSGFVWSAASAGNVAVGGDAYALGGNALAGLYYQPRELGVNVRCVRE